MSQRDNQNLIWIDCEMTGLEPSENVIIEIATVITTSTLELIAEGPVFAISQPESRLLGMDDWNRSHHKASGLWDRVLESTTTMAEAEAATLDFISTYCYKGKSPLCGNSIGQDKRFLEKDMPALYEYFHYQVIDVSSVKQLVGRWLPPEAAAPAKKERHLALSDINESIAELRHYKQLLFGQPPATGAKEGE